MLNSDHDMLLSREIVLMLCQGREHRKSLVDHFNTRPFMGPHIQLTGSYGETITCSEYDGAK
jgi:hypothetical protein